MTGLFSRRAVLPTRSRSLFRSQWNFEIIYNRWMHVVGLSAMAALFVMLVSQPLHMAPKTPTCRVYDPAHGLGIALDSRGARQLCTEPNR
jgi:hypothetical protein